MMIMIMMVVMVKRNSSRPEALPRVRAVMDRALGECYRASKSITWLAEAEAGASIREHLPIRVPNLLPLPLLSPTLSLRPSLLTCSSISHLPLARLRYHCVPLPRSLRLLRLIPATQKIQEIRTLLDRKSILQQQPPRLRVFQSYFFPSNYHRLLRRFHRRGSGKFRPRRGQLRGRQFL